MAYSDALIAPCEAALNVSALGKIHSDFWTRSHPGMKAAGYAVASLIGLAIMPALFMVMDHDFVVHWSNGILDFVSR
jgi:hypothetical protein